jgi:hypothetical protein
MDILRNAVTVSYRNNKLQLINKQMIFTTKRLFFLTLGIIFGLFNLYAQDRGNIELGANLGLSLASIVAPVENKAVNQR